MIRLYAGSGSWEIQLLGQHLPEAEWHKLRENVLRLLKARKRSGVGLLQRLPWELRDGTNWFGDEFCVLYASLPIERYVLAVELEHNEKAKEAAQSVAKAFEELGTFVRFVAFGPDVDSTPAAVPSPDLETSVEVVSRALNDAERLLQTSGAVSAVDRVHTALHGYLRHVCQTAQLQLAGDESATALWKRIRTDHPAFTTDSAQSVDLARIVNSLAAAVDALNTIRNKASVAHPNERLLGEPEAMLAVNSARTILHYIDARARPT